MQQLPVFFNLYYAAISLPSFFMFGSWIAPFQILTDSLSDIILEPVSCLLYSAFRLTSSQL